MRHRCAWEWLYPFEQTCPAPIHTHTTLVGTLHQSNGFAEMCKTPASWFLVMHDEMIDLFKDRSSSFCSRLTFTFQSQLTEYETFAVSSHLPFPNRSGWNHHLGGSNAGGNIAPGQAEAAITDGYVCCRCGCRGSHHSVHYRGRLCRDMQAEAAETTWTAGSTEAHEVSGELCTSSYKQTESCAKDGCRVCLVDLYRRGVVASTKGLTGNDCSKHLEKVSILEHARRLHLWLWCVRTNLCDTNWRIQNVPFIWFCNLLTPVV